MPNDAISGEWDACAAMSTTSMGPKRPIWIELSWNRADLCQPMLTPQSGARDLRATRDLVSGCVARDYWVVARRPWSVNRSLHLTVDFLITEQLHIYSSNCPIWIRHGLYTVLCSAALEM